MQVISKRYEEYLQLFGTMFQNGEDIVGETLIKTYKTIMCNGLKNIDINNKEKKEQAYFNYFFLSCKLNNFTEQKSIKAQNELRNQKENPFETEDKDEKIKSQIYKDYKLMYIVQLVENNFDVIDYRCFRLYHLLKNMTYAKLRDMTGIRNCKTRVVRINKWLRENVTEREIRQSFINDYPDFE